MLTKPVLVALSLLQGSIKFLVPHYISEMNAARLGLVSHITATLIMGSSPRGTPTAAQPAGAETKRVRMEA